MKKSFMWTLSAITLVIPVSAYLDPSSGSMLLQILLGGIATAALIIKTRWQKVKSFFRRKTPVQDQKE